jgi:DNA-binding CsgD family transcriptional regulator
MRRRQLDELTDREREVLELLRHDFTNEQIASELGISLDGAKYHVSQILSKLGVATREEAAVWRPKERSWYWKLAWIGVAGALASAVAGIALAVSDRGTNVTVESGVYADEPATSLATSPPIGQMALHTPTQEQASPTPTATPIVAPTVVLIGPTVVNIFDLPTPEPQPTPTATETPGPTATPAATPTPCESACSGIWGRVVKSPICGPDSYPPIPGCEPQPHQATVIVWTSDRSEQLLQFTSDEQGNFRVPLAEGDYYIEPLGSAGTEGSPAPFLITVPPDRFVELTLHYDTGIR